MLQWLSQVTEEKRVSICYYNTLLQFLTNALSIWNNNRNTTNRYRGFCASSSFVKVFLTDAKNKSLVIKPALPKDNIYVEQECWSQSTIGDYDCTWNEVQNNGWPNLTCHSKKGIHDFRQLYISCAFNQLSAENMVQPMFKILAIPNFTSTTCWRKTKFWHLLQLPFLLVFSWGFILVLCI